MNTGNRLGRTASFALLAAVGTVGCSSSSDDASGTISISLMDRPVDGVAELNLTISQVRLKPSGGAPFELAMSEPEIQVDLLSLTDENAAVLVDNASVPAGSYEWAEFVVEDDDIADSNALTLLGQMVPLRVPSGSIRLVSGFEVGENVAVRFLFDWDARKGLTDPVGQDGYLLRPAFRILDADAYSAISGVVTLNAILGNFGNFDPELLCTQDDTDPDVGNVIYVYEGLGVIPDEMDDVPGDDAEPVATAVATPDTGGDYAFRVALAPGEYTIAATCVGQDDSDELDGNVWFAPVAYDVTLVAGEEEAGIGFCDPAATICPPE